VDSFEVALDVPCFGDGIPFHAVSHPRSVDRIVGEGVEVLANLEGGRIVAARQGRLMATSFHPELTRDVRFHKFFMEMAK
jgi:5'-phosphate synthase pdxT subunit